MTSLSDFSDPHRSSDSSVDYSRVDDLINKRLDRYVIHNLLGEGSMGAVYLAHDVTLDRTVALKTLHPDWTTDGQAIERFRREARYGAALQHPHICPVFDLGASQSVHYLTMRYVEGVPLSETLKTNAISLTEKVEIIATLAKAIQYAHDQNILHRDLKPANVLMHAAGPVLTDFGMARHIEDHQQITDSGQSIGTIAYMPYEQIRADHANVGPHSDVYSLGVMLFECLTGQLPFGGDVVDIVRAVMKSEAPAVHELVPQIDDELSRLVSRMLLREHDKRVQTMDEVILSLESWLERERRRSLTLPFQGGSESHQFSTGVRVTELRVAGKRPRVMTHDRPFLIGRDERGVDLRIKTNDISRRHALLVSSQPQSHPTLIDLNSRKGIRFKEQEIAMTSLDDAGEFFLGPVSVRYHSEIWEDEFANYLLGSTISQTERMTTRKAINQKKPSELLRFIELSQPLVEGLGGAERLAKHIPKVHHPNLARRVEIVSDHQRAFVAQRWVHQRSLKKYRRRRGPLSWAMVLKIGKELSLALDYCDTQGLIHAGISPETIFVSSRRRTILTEFPIQISDLKSLPPPPLRANADCSQSAFSAPEKYQSYATYGMHAELYAVCASLLWAMLLDHREFYRSPLRGVDQWMKDPGDTCPTPVRSALVTVFRKGLQPAIEDRFQSVLEFRKAWQAASLEIDSTLTS